MSEQELAFMSVRELGRLLRARETSPIEVTRLALERLESIGRRLRAVVTVTSDLAERQAAIAEAELRAGVDRGPLHGIPYGAKDILATSGIATTWGATPFRDQMFDRDATVIRKLRDAGAILVAKLATIELAGGFGYDNPDAAFTGPAVNPWNPDTWPGGSSSGPAAAVAGGLASFAIGSDTGGSITMPSAWSGVSGMRATYGRVSRSGAMALCWTLDRLGPMCRSADDCGLVLEAIAGHDLDDPSSLRGDYRYRRHRPRRHGFRLAVIAGSTEGAEPEVRANFETSLETLRRLGTVDIVDLPNFPYADVLEVIIAAESYSAFDDFIDRGGTLELTAPKARVHRLAAMVLPARTYLRAQRIRRKIALAMDDLAGAYDALVAPTLGMVASGLHDDFEYMLPSASPQPVGYAGNLAGLPTVTIPNGFGRAGLPTAIAFTGRVFEDNAVLDAACALQNQTYWHGQHPAL